MRIKPVRNPRREHRLADTAQTCRDGFRVSMHHNLAEVPCGRHYGTLIRPAGNGESGRVSGDVNTSGPAAHRNSPHLVMAASKLSKRNVPHFSP